MKFSQRAKRALKRVLRPLNRLSLLRARVDMIETQMRSYPDTQTLQTFARGWARTEARVRRLEVSLLSSPKAECAAEESRTVITLQQVLYPGLSLEKWQMRDSERMALTGLLYRLRPRYALEVGVYWGGSLRLIAEFCERAW